MRSLSITIGIVLGISFFTACTSTEKRVKESEKTATEEFSELANEEGFAEQHDEPLTLEVEARGTMEKLDVEGGEAANIYRISKEGSTNYLLVIHEWWGLNNHIISEADQLYEKLGNTNVIALDLYDGKLATTREKATEYMQGADEERILSIIKAVIASLPEGAKVGTVGWCFGGGWSLRTALAAGNKTQACVMYYGMPIQEVEKMKVLNSDVLFIFAEKDQWINKEVATQFEANMKEAGKEIEVLAFDADHAFANPSSERYIETAAQKANQAAFEYLKERLK